MATMTIAWLMSWMTLNRLRDKAGEEENALALCLQPGDDDFFSFDSKSKAVRRSRRGPKKDFSAIRQIKDACVTWADEHGTWGFKGCLAQDLSRVFDKVDEAFLMRASAVDDRY